MTDSLHSLEGMVNAIQFYLLILLSCAISAAAENWPQASGPNRNYQITEVSDPPTKWSVVRNESIVWRQPLPEGGQSAVTVWGNHAFVTTHRPIQEGDALTEPNLVGYCLNAHTGEVIWQVDLPGTDPVQMAGIFSDATVFAPVTDGQHVWFFNRCGSMACFDLDGSQVWLREFTPRKRHTNRQCEPVLFGDTLLSVEVRDKEAGQRLQRHKPVPDGVDPKSVWTYLHGIDSTTGKVKWIGQAGTAVHNTPIVRKQNDADWAVLHGRGGGHGPLEKPYGLSLSSATTGREIWSYEVKGGGDSVFNSHWIDDQAFWFHKEHHLVLDSSSGKLLRQDSVTESVNFCRFQEKTQTWKTENSVSIPPPKRQPITNQTNIVVEDWHYFLAHDLLALGRVNIQDGRTEYLQLPAQKIASPSSEENDRLIWNKKDSLANDTKNSRGINIAEDKRASNTGWGHVSAASPIAINQYLFIPIMNGTVYVIDTSTATLDENSIVAINDLGKAGETWCLASFSFANGNLFIHTMKEVICIGKE